jgi:hypothetical protein
VLRLPVLILVFAFLVAFWAGEAGLRAAGTTKPSGSHARARRANERTGRLVPAFDELVKAHRRGDRNALGRLADRIGPARLAEAMLSGDGRLAEAALAAAPLARGGVLLVAPASANLWIGDPAREAGAATALGSLLDGATPTELEDWDVPPDVVAGACSGLSALALRTNAALAARLAALDAALAAAPICGAPVDLEPLVHDPAPAIRRAAVLTSAVGARRAAILNDAIADPDRGVSAVAVATDCRVEGRLGAAGKETPPSPQSIATARALATAQTTPPEDAVEMLDCLAAAGTPADRALLDGLRRGPPSPLRDRAVELGAAPRGRGD